MNDDGRMTLMDVEQTYGQLPTAKEVLYDWYGANRWLFETINGIHGPNYDDFMLFATQIGNKHFFLPYLMVLGVYAVLSTLYRKLFHKAGVRQHFIMWLGVFAVVMTSFVVYALAVYWLKEHFSYARPYVWVEGATLLESRKAEDAYHAFPSGHVAFISVMIFSLWPMMSHHIKLFGLGIIALVAWSRVALGVHFPADAVWGFLIGFAIVFAVRAVIYMFLRKLFGMHCDGRD